MININLSKLTLNQLFTLGLRIKEILSGFKPADLGIAFFVNAFLSVFERYAKSFEQTKASSKQIAEKDGVRDNMFIAFTHHVNNYLYHPDDDIKNGAGNLMNDIDTIGEKIYRKDYKTETAMLESVISLVNNNYSDLVENIHADEWFMYLTQAQSDFENTLRELSIQKAIESDIDSTSDIKPELVKALRKLFDFLPMQYELTQNETLGKLIATLKAETDRF